MTYDFTIVGAGIIGLSTAYKLSGTYPDAQILILEKENQVAAHQTGRNSGVIHSGIYYDPNSYRAKNCVNGRHQLVDFCRRYDVEHEICGKVIVAAGEAQLDTLNHIFKTGQINAIEGIRKIDSKELKEIEPFAEGIKAIHVPCTGIVDYTGVCKKLHQLIKEKKGRIQFSQEVKKINKAGGSLTVTTKTDQFRTQYIINCAGLYADHVAQSAGVQLDMQIVPFRGEYYRLKPEAEQMVQGLIYPIPNTDFPFLGVHFTKMALGGVECGPNAVFAFKREGYDKLSFNLEETLETVNFAGFWNLAKKHWRMGLDEYYRSFSKKAFVRGLQTLIPTIRSHHLEAAPSGVRATALDPEGNIITDFKYVTRPHEIHVLNAPSPAATAGLAIGDEIVERAQKEFAL
jgi:L-2-hydroxyglutarate oxidase